MKINKKTLFAAAIVVVVGLLAYKKIQAEDMGEINVSYVTEQYQRGQTIATDALEAQFDVNIDVDVPLVDLDVYASGLLTRLTDTGADNNDFRIGGTTALSDSLTLDVGGRYLDLSSVSKEVYAGLRLEGVLSPSVYVYRSLNQDFTAVEANVEIDYELDLWLAAFDSTVRGTVGYTEGPVKTGYYGVSYTLTHDLTESGSIFAGVEAIASTTDEYSDSVGFTVGYTHTF
jgi:hypothetical protein